MAWPSPRHRKRVPAASPPAAHLGGPCAAAHALGRRSSVGHFTWPTHNVHIITSLPSPCAPQNAGRQAGAYCCAGTAPDGWWRGGKAALVAQPQWVPSVPAPCHHTDCVHRARSQADCKEPLHSWAAGASRSSDERRAPRPRLTNIQYRAAQAVPARTRIKHHCHPIPQQLCQPARPVALHPCIPCQAHEETCSGVQHRRAGHRRRHATCPITTCLRRKAPTLQAVWQRHWLASEGACDQGLPPLRRIHTSDTTVYTHRPTSGLNVLLRLPQVIAH